MDALSRFTSLRWVGLLGALWCAAVEAQVFDRIDVATGNEKAEITIRFAPKIQYLRHGPLAEVREMRVFLRLLDSAVPESELMQDTVRSPATPRVPALTATFPELRNGMLVTFAQPTSYDVKPGPDGRSIVVTVPLLPAPKEELARPAPAAPPPVLPVVPVPPTPPVVAVTPPSPTPAPAAAAATPPAASSGEAAPAGPVAEPPEEYTPAQPVRSPAEVEAQAKAYLAEARQAMDDGNLALAINRLNRILGLPATPQTEAAQALIGEAREANGEPFKAKAEYELYLKLFPTGPNLAKVKQRLARLPKEGAVPPVAQKPAARPAGPAEWTVSGSASVYYYSGKSKIETLVPPPPGELTFNRETLSFTDQRSLITSLNLNARRRDVDTDSRLVVRDTDNRNDLDPQRSYNRLYAAYFEHNDRKRGYNLRLGRQNPSGMGVIDRFDGAQGGYHLDNDWRVNGVAGRAVEFGSPFEKDFYGAGAEYVAISGRPGVGFYAIEQKLDDFVNRRALGTEVRYFDGQYSGYATLDYDLLYRGINIALIQGNYLDGAGNNYFFVYDYRRSPSYGLTSALLAAPGFTLQDMIAVQGIDAVRNQAKDLSALSELFSVGVTHPLSENWQLGVDYRLSSISATKPVFAVLPLAIVGTCLGTVDTSNDTCVFSTPAQPGSGDSHVVTLQAIGNNVFFRNATGVASLSYIKAPTFRAQAYGINYALPLGEPWRLDTNLRYYQQRDDNGDEQDRLSPSVKLSYQWRNSLYLEGETGAEKTNTTGAGRDDTINRDYWYFGLRWDFR